MKRVLPRTSYLIACILFSLLISVFSFANKPFFASITGHASLPGGHIRSVTSLMIIAPADVEVNTDPWTNVATKVSLGNPTVYADNGTTYTITNNAPTSFPIGTTKVVWTVTNNSGNTVSVTQNVTVIDNQKPYIFRMGEIGVVNDPGKCGAVVDLFIPYTDDNSGLPVALTNDAPSFFPVGSTLIVWTATDAFGNSDTSTQLITVIDNEKPSIKIDNVTAFTDAGKNGAVVNLGTPEASDNCGVVTVTNNAPAFFPIGVTLVTWTATDKMGYTSSVVQTVTVTDNEKPVITAAANSTLKNTTGKCGANSQSLVAPSVSDNSGVVMVTNNAPALLLTGNTLVTWVATDVNGNSSTVTQTVLVQDAEAPVFKTVPADVTVSCNAIPSLVNPVVTDNCDVSPVVTFSQTSTQSSNTNLAGRYNYTITRTWVAKDITGNTATAKQVITVADKTAPTLAISANITVNNDVNKCGAVVRYAAATATDICGSPVTISYSIGSGAMFPSGTTVVTVTAKDVSGNIATKTFTVKVNDTQKPTINAPTDLNLTVTGLTGTITNLNLGLPVSTDNCGVKSVGNNAPAFYPVGITRVTWTVTDNSGNTSTDVQKITVTAIAGSGAVKKNSALVTDVSPVAKMMVENEAASDEIKISVAPNPSSTYFILIPQTKSDMPISLKITDAAGRMVETRSKLPANNKVQIGGEYLSGLYFAEMIQGSQHAVVQLLKVK